MLLTEIEEIARKEIIDTIKKWKLSSYIEMPSEWASGNRVIPPGQSEFPGPIDHSIAPHMVEIQDCFHPDSGISHVSIQKSTQSLATTTLENVIGWAIKHKLHNILYVISSKNIAGVRSSAAIDVMIDNSGLAEYVKPISTRMRRKIADGKYYKELVGGRRLMMTSWNSIGDAKSLTWDLIILDEINEAPYELKGQGDPEKIFEARGVTARGLKVAKLSTPTNMTGRITKNFLEGDRRYFFCKCPLCGELQVLKLMAAGREHGLIGRSETIDGVEQIIKDSVNYVCTKCKEKIYEYQKGFMLQNGVWVPTARPINSAYRSYQISNLMSPIMFFSWEMVMQAFCETDYGQSITKFKAFVINILGEPWESRSEKKNWTDLKDRAEDYPLGEIPEGGLVVTGHADVQKNRIELQSVAWGVNMENWVIDYQVFYGQTCQKNNQVWTDLKNFVNTKKYKLKNINLPFAKVGLDSGYNPARDDNETDASTEHVVYEFVARNSVKFIACRGNPKLKDRIIKEERVIRKSLLKRRYDVAVSELKDETFIKLDYSPGMDGYIHFSSMLNDDYFRGFVSEVFKEIAPGKWGWDKIFDRNEPLDTYIGSRAVAEYLNLPAWTEQAWSAYRSKIFN